MTSTLARGAGSRSLGGPVPLGALAASPALIILLLAALGLRLTIAYVLFPASGFATDIASYASWALTLGEHGPAGFYANAGFSDYPPGYLYLLWPIGLLARATADPVSVASGLVKLPPIGVDLAVGYVLYRLVRGWAWPGRDAERLGLLGAALYVLNPVSFYDSALWGQSDAVGALALLLGLAALIRGNSEGATAMAAAAALIKPQFGVVLVPLVGVVLLKRHLLRVGSGPRHPPWGPAGLAAWLDRHRGPVRLVTSGLVGLLVFHAVSLPFGLDIPGYLRLMADTAGGYAYLSVNAFNPWALVGSAGSPSLASGLTWSSDAVPFVGPVPAVAIGATLLAAGFLWALARAAIRDDRWTLIVALAVLAIAFFVLPTRVHERYLFPAVAIVPLIAVASRRWLVALVLLSLGALINMHAVLTWPIYATESVADLPLGATFRTTPFIVASVLLQAGVLAFAAWQLRPSLATTPDAFDRAARARGPRAAAGAASSPAPPPPAPAPDARGPAATDWVRGPGVLDQLALRFTRPALRRPVGPTGRRERPGRIDRLDVLVLVLLVVSAAAIRGFRSDEPFGMYFDEVYHARTATEFLQHWEYGEPHAIYEYTHPHLAKYAMAAGIVLLGGNRVSGNGDLGSPVEDAAVEPRWAPPEAPGERRGDRLYVATGNELRVLDLASRTAIGSIGIDAVALALDPVAHRLYVADAAGAIRTLDTTVLDVPVGPALLAAGLLEPIVERDEGPVQRLYVTDVSVITLDDTGRLRAYDRDDGSPLAERALDGALDLATLPRTERVVVDLDAAGDPAEVADRLASLLAADSVAYAATLAQGPRRVVLDAYLDEAGRGALSDAIEEGTLDGVSLVEAPLVAVAGTSGVSILDAETLDVVDELLTMAPVTGLTLVARGLDEPTLYAAGGDELSVIPIRDDGPSIDTSVRMPGPVRDAAWNEPANLVHVVGETAAAVPTVYVIEVHANAVFADAELPFDPTLLLLDLQPERPSIDRGQALAFAADGRVAAIDVLREAAAWRMPGVLMGALTAGLIYLLARLLVERRSVALFAGTLVLVEGMLFANARIAMNDVYVTTFILLAAVLFAPIYTGQVRRGWIAALLLIGVGTALGLGLAAKWVALYAIGGLLLLVLLRSALGRWLALAGFVAMTAVLGAIAIRAPETADPSRNWTFLALMLLLTMALAAGIVRRPLPASRPEVIVGGVLPILAGVALLGGSSVVRDPLVGGLVDGIGLAAAGIGAIAAGLIILAIGTWWRRRRPIPDGRHPRRPISAFLTPARAMGLGWLFTLAVLTVVPIALYVASYAPWVALGNQWVEGLPAGHDGQTLAELTLSMYRYHDDLRAAHAASSPWWAWPLDLKPVWFYQDSFAGPTTGLIHDTGNLVVFWLGVPAMAFLGWAAWRRRSVSLAIVVVLWLSLWLPWARIDRATFQYHVYASLPFLVIALAYLLGELWRGPGPRTWFLARLSAALAILGIPLLWLARQPLCRLAGSATANPDGVSCGEIERTASISPAAIVSLLVLAAGASVIAWLAWRGSLAARRDYPGSPARGRSRASIVLAVIAVALATLGGVAVATIFLDRQGGISLTVSPEILAVLGLVVLAPVAWAVIRARDARRLVLGIVAAAAIWFVVWYPNIAGLPLPSSIAHVYQGVLPTWNYDFQFAVNLDPPAPGSLIDSTTIVIGSIALACAVGAAVTARAWGRRSRSARGATAAGGGVVASGAGRSSGP